ncbi:MAG: cytidine deaminase [Rubrivivax sp.]|nr:cytidine deaminase [Rubrivivax sp.]
MTPTDPHAPARPALPENTRSALIAAAQAARTNAYAPYSKFAVGAAVLDEQGRIHAGCNVENAAYPQGWCAETSALAAMVAAGGRRVQAVAVCAVSPQPITPCGSCRQKLREFAADDCPVWAADLQGLQATHTLGELLPFSFGPHHLGAAEPS